MDKDYYYNILRSALDEKELPFMGNVSDYLKIFTWQGLLPYLYPVFKKEEFKKYYYSAITKDAIIDEELRKVIDILSEHQIKHVLLKGFYLKRLYPFGAMRTMNDVDILIDDKDFKEAKKLLVSLGYEAEKRIVHHCGFLNSNLHLEVHYSLMGPNSLYGKRFLDWQDNLLLLDNYTYKLNDNYHLLFIIAHYAKHMKSSGAGIRGIIDIYLLFRNAKLDILYIKEELSKIKLLDFFYIIVEIIDIVFEYKICSYEKNEDITDILNYILKNAPNGSSDLVDVNSLAKSNGSKMKMYLSKVFIPYNDIKIVYPFARFILLAPVAYFCYFVRKVTNIRKSDKRIETINKIETSEIDKTNELLERMGLKNDSN